MPALEHALAEPSDRPIRLVVVDDQWLVRLGLMRLFEHQQRIAVVGEAATAAEALRTVQRQAPDVLLVNAVLPDATGVEVCRQVCDTMPHTRVILMSSQPDEDALVQSIKAGASGFVLKRSQPESFITAVRDVADGSASLDRAATETILNWMRSGRSTSGEVRHQLSDQERRILPLIAEGMTNRQIAARLILSESTVKTYVSGLLKKLHLSRRSEAAAYAARTHFVA
jgi:DNA-binding NarL/FixJ family response regulator